MIRNHRAGGCSIPQAWNAFSSGVAPAFNPVESSSLGAQTWKLSNSNVSELTGLCSEARRADALRNPPGNQKKWRRIGSGSGFT